MANKLLVLGVAAALFGCDGEPGPFDAGFDAGEDVDAGRVDAGRDVDAGRGVDAGRDMDAGRTGLTDTLALSTAQEVPVCAAAGETAMGSGSLTIDSGNTIVIVSDLAYSGLSGPVTSAHIHLGDPGMTGPPIFTFTNLTSPINETFDAADYPSPPPAGAPADFAAFLDVMRAGGAYVNIHTDACGPGEIRDQIASD